MSVTNSRPHPDGVRRRRECQACGVRVTTLEVERDEYEALKSEADIGAQQHPMMGNAGRSCQ